MTRPNAVACAVCGGLHIKAAVDQSRFVEPYDQPPLCPVCGLTGVTEFVTVEICDEQRCDHPHHRDRGMAGPVHVMSYA